MHVVQLPDGIRRGIPVWMFDEEICAAVRDSSRPIVDVSSLLDIVKLLEMNGWEIRSARDENTSPSKGVSDVEVAIHSSNPSVRKRRNQQASPGGKKVRVRRVNSGADRSGNRSVTKPNRGAP